MSVRKSISLWGVRYLQRKSTPKNECLQLKTLDFWRLWKWRNWCDHEDLIFTRATWSMMTFVFVVSFSLSWVIGNTVLLKGVEEILRKNFQVMLNSNPTPTNPFEWSHWKSHTVQSISSVAEMKSFWSLRNLFWLRSYEFASADCLHSEEHDSPEVFDTQNSDRCCATRQLSQNIYPPNGHITQGHLCLITSTAP